MSYTVKPQTPLMLGENFIYPLTTADQVVVGAGTENERRLEVGGKVEADQLGGMTYQMIVDLIYPIGRTITTLSDADNPNTMYPWQTWERTAKGRMFIGTGAPEANDDGTSPGDYNMALGSTGGNSSVKILRENMPANTYAGIVINESGSYWTIERKQEDHNNGDFAIMSVNDAGVSEKPMDNMSPYIAANIWKRVS